MTANSLAALLAGLPRYELNCHSVELETEPNGNWLDRDDVLAALAAAVPADLAEAESVAVDLCRTGELSMPYRCDIAEIIRELIARIAAQEAQIKGLQADKFKMRDERDKAKIAASNYAEFNHTWRARAEAAETALAASEARVAKLVEAGKWAFGHIATLPMDEASQADFMRHRAAITEATK